MTEPSTTNANNNRFNLNPELTHEFWVELHGETKSGVVEFVSTTARDRFEISHVPPGQPASQFIKIAFKQVQNGNLYSMYNGLWYRLKGALFSIVQQWYPFVKVTKHRLNFVKQFQLIFGKFANNAITIRTEIEEKLGPLPYAISTMLGIELPQTRDRLYIIDGGALKFYNTKARFKKWQIIGSLDVLAYYISQIFPAFKCGTERKRYSDINEISRDRIVLACDLISVASEIERALNQLMS